MNSIKLSIIIPVCNVEKYIGACLESIYRQGLDEKDFEVIVIDDGSADGSMQIVEGIRGSHHNISVIHQENAGPSVSRNSGMEIATGDYVLFVDSDDLLMDGGLSMLLPKAMEIAADMVVPDYLRMNDEDITKTFDAKLTSPDIVDMSGYNYYVNIYNPAEGSFIWRILYKRSFLNKNNIRLVPGVYYEDIPFLQECYLKADRVIGLHLLYYIYRIRPRSCTYSFTMKNALDYNTAIANSWALLKMRDLPDQVLLQVRNNVSVFLNYAIDCIISVFPQSSERREIILDLVHKVPDLSYHQIRWRLFRKKVHNWCLARLKLNLPI